MIDLRSLRPLDEATIVASVKKTNRAVIVGENWRMYGIGAEIAAVIQEFAFDYLDAPIARVSSADVPDAVFKGPGAGGAAPRELGRRGGADDAAELPARCHVARKDGPMPVEIVMPRLSDTWKLGRSLDG